MDLYSPPRYPVLVFKREIAQRMKNMVASCMKVGAKAITEFMTESGRIEHEACHGILNNSVQMIEVSKHDQDSISIPLEILNKSRSGETVSTPVHTIILNIIPINIKSDTNTNNVAKDIIRRKNRQIFLKRNLHF